MALTLIIKELAKELRYSLLAFSKEVGVKNSTLDQAIRRNQEMGSDLVEKIITRFPQVSKSWLETGVKPMFMEKEPIQNNPDIPSAIPTEKSSINTGSEPQKNSVNSSSKHNEKPMEDEFKEMFKQMMTNMQTLIASNGEATIATKEAAIAAKESALAAKEANINNGALIRSQEKLIDNMLHKKSHEEKGKHPHMEVK